MINKPHMKMMKLKFAIALLFGLLFFFGESSAQTNSDATETETENTTLETSMVDSLKNVKYVYVKMPADMVLADTADAKKKESPEKEKGFKPLGGVDWFKGEDFLGLGHSSIHSYAFHIYLGEVDLLPHCQTQGFSFHLFPFFDLHLYDVFPSGKR
jgi:hypothetical protein